MPAEKANEAIAFYMKHLDAKCIFRVTNEQMLAYDKSMQVLPEQKDWIAHSVLKIGNGQLMVADDLLPELHYARGNNLSLCLEAADTEIMRSQFEAIAAQNGSKTVRPFGATPFSPAYGIVQDPFGVIIQFSSTAKV
ncbi:MAG: VOC family protein [Anaerolineaceae bacterium]|nr:VOC family protein [Anaerolineaceae bacterium]